MNRTKAKASAGLVGVIVTVVTAFTLMFMIPALVNATPISDVNQPDDQVTTICPDGTVILAVMECANPNPTEAVCPSDQLVIITPTGQCTAVPTPFECPNGVLAPIEEQCNDSLPPTLPSIPPASASELLPPQVSEPQPSSLPQIPLPFENVGAQQPDQVGGGQDDDDGDTQSEDSSDDDDDDSDSDNEESNEDEFNNSGDDEGDDGGGELD
ncbi:MAG: hypothetical protein ACRD8W_02325 [Nitrososphaeraceae archaeon]